MMRHAVVAAALAGVWTVALSTGVSARPAQPPIASGAMETATAAQLSALPAGEMTTVMVTLRARADLGAIQGATRKVRLTRTINALRSTSDSSQTGIRARLRQREREGAVASFTPLWVSNAVSVTATPDVIAELAASPEVLSVTPDQIEIVPSASPATVSQDAIRASSVWDLADTGQGVVIANLDSGVDVSHPDLATRWRGGSNSWFDPYGQRSTPTDLTGHGTGTMGVMVGGDASGASIGTAPGASWIAARVFNDVGAATATAVHQAFQWVLDPDGNPSTADAPWVVNGSWSLGAGPGCDLTFQPDVQALRAAGILPVFAAGNFGPGASTSVSPANYPESLSVGAVSGSNLVSSSSSRGPSTCGGRSRAFPDVVAPGVSVYTADRYGMYQSLSGTSVAAPHAAGALALMLSAVPGLTADQQLAAMVGSAQDLGTAGPDETYGAGLVDAAAAHQAVLAAPPAPDFTVSVAPASVTVEAGGPATYAVQVSPLNGFAQDVALSLSGLSGAEGTWVASPAVVSGGGGTSELVVSTTATIAPGAHALTVTATGGGLTRTAVAELMATQPPPPPPPPPPPTPGGAIRYSTVGNAAPAGLPGDPDDADVYGWSGTDHSRLWDASVARLPAGANVDGLTWVDANHFYLSFTDRVVIPRPGSRLVVEDEDVVYYDAGVWRLWFDGSSHRLPSSVDVVGAAVVGGTLYFATGCNVVPPGGGKAGSGDDADVYRWNPASGGNTYTRVFDATDAGLPAALTVDALDLTDPAHLYLSFSNADATVPGLGVNGVQDEDVVSYANGIWSLYFDGTSHGLGGSPDLDVDAVDIP